jgi:ABC-type sugar transport system ATPase subunit
MSRATRKQRGVLMGDDPETEASSEADRTPAGAAAVAVPTLAARSLTKSFGHVRALRGVEFEAYAGEVTALIGDNGAGKSTLIKCLGVGTVQDMRVPVASFSGGQRQSVAIARAAMWAQRAIIMDEPTAALGVIQTVKVLELVSRIRERGLAVVFISHNLPQVLEIADRIEVMRLGARVARFRRGETSVEQLIGAISGAFSNEAPA